MEATQRTTNTIVQVNQAYIAPSQGNMQRGRTVQKETSNIQPFRQIAVAQNTPQRTTIEYAPTAYEETTRNELRELAPAIHIDTKLNDFVHIPVYQNIPELPDESWTEDNALLRIMSLMKKITPLKKRLSSHYSAHDSSIFSIMANCYSKHLHLALKHLQDKANTKYIWEYYVETNILADFFYYQEDDHQHKKDNREKLTALYEQCIDNELNYLESIKDKPTLISVMKASSNLDTLLSEHAPLCFFKFIEEAKIEQFKERKELLVKTINLTLNGLTRREKREELYTLEKQTLSDANNLQDKRKYHDTLAYNIEKVMQKGLIHKATIYQRICILETLIAFLSKHIDSVNEFRLLRQDLIASITTISKKILLAIATIKIPENTDILKERSLRLIHSLLEFNILDDVCHLIYSLCITQPYVTECPATNYQFSIKECQQHVRCIFAVLDCQADDRFLVAAEILKSLLHKKQKINRNPTTLSLSLKADIKNIKSQLYIQLFVDILRDYNGCNKRATPVICQLMSPYQQECIKLTPYKSMILDKKNKKLWTQICYYAFSSDLAILAEKHFLLEKDADLLLDLCYVSTNTFNPYLKTNLNLALMRYLRCSLHNQFDSIPIKTDIRIYHWLQDLCVLKILDDATINLHNLLQIKIQVITHSLPTNLASCKLIDRIYALYQLHTIDGYIDAAKLLNTNITHSQSAVRALAWIRNLLFDELFNDTCKYDDEPSDTSIYDKSPCAIKIAECKNIFYRNKDIMFICSSIYSIEKWNKLACFSWKTSILDLLEQSKYNDDDIKEILRLRDTAPCLNHASTRTITQNVLIKIFNYCLRLRSNNTLSLTLLDQITEWIDQPESIKIWREDLVSKHEEFKLMRKTIVSTTPKQPLSHPECVKHNPLSRAIKTYILDKPFDIDEQSQFPYKDGLNTQIPTQDNVHQSHSLKPTNDQQEDQSTLTQQANFMSIEGIIHESILYRYRPMDYAESKTDNSYMITGQQYLLQSSLLYQKEKENKHHRSSPNTTLFTNTKRDYFLLFQNGIDLLTRWITQLDGNLIESMTIYDDLINITHEDGPTIIQNLFNRLIDSQVKKVNFEEVSNLLCLRNYLLSICTPTGLSGLSSA